MFTALHSKLSTGGKLLIVTRPPCVEFPFFQQALDVFAKGQDSHHVFEQELNDAGFCVKSHCISYPMSIEKARWIRMMKARFMSILAGFSEEELDAGIAEVDKAYSGHQAITFADNLIFIVATKES